MQSIVLDTNILMEYPEIIKKIINDYNIILSIVTIEELDNLKIGQYGNQAREAIRNINDNLENIIVDREGKVSFLVKNDNAILGCAKKYDALICTFDLNMKIKAKALGIECFEVDLKNKIYKGYKIVKLSDVELAELYEKDYKVNNFDLLCNQYLLIESSEGEIVDKLKWTNDGFVKLKLPTIKGFKPLNHLQQCAFDLMASDVPIRVILGNIGSGKTIISLRNALYYLEKGKYERILYVRNPIGKGEQIGWLPGNKLEKMEVYLSGVIDNMEMGDLQFKQLVSQEKIIVECPYFLKGASKENTWFLVDEAEDLDIETLKLIGTRVAKNSVINFSGDLHQIEKKYKSNNGLIQFVNKFQGNPLVGIIKLSEDVRSDVSRLFNKL